MNVTTAPTGPDYPPIAQGRREVDAKLAHVASGGASKSCGLMLGVLAVMFAAPALATTVLFNFQNLGSVSINQSLDDALGNPTNSHALPYATASTGAEATNSYNGDNHVVGDTLANYDGDSAPKNYFVINNGPSYDSFTLTFYNISVESFSFDWEIFPDASCVIDASSACLPANYPDMSVYAGGMLQVTPTIIATEPATADSSGQRDPQGIGFVSIGLASAVNTLEFEDWPATIGIDNLCISTTNGCLPPKTVPEPSPLTLTGLALALLALVRWKAQRGPAPTC